MPMVDAQFYWLLFIRESLITDFFVFYTYTRADTGLFLFEIHLHKVISSASSYFLSITNKILVIIKILPLTFVFKRACFESYIQTRVPTGKVSYDCYQNHFGFSLLVLTEFWKISKMDHWCLTENVIDCFKYIPFGSQFVMG